MLSRGECCGLPRLGGAARERPTTRSRGSPRTASATTSAGAAGAARTPSTRRCATWSTCCSAVNAGCYSIEQANPRHEHEWRVWEDVKLPEGRKLIPGVVTHHDQRRRAPRARRPAPRPPRHVVGPENVIAGTDCGFAQGALITRVHEEIQWAKLEALAEGAKLASRELWGAKAAA